MALEHLHERETAILKRLAAGLSDQQIADDLFLSLHTVKWYNRQMYSKLGVKSRTQAIACAKDCGLLPAEAAPRQEPGHQLPIQSTSFIGRGRELADVKRLMRQSRLLTLTGTGGTGKTRLALRAAELDAASFADGVCFVDLAPLADHTLVATAIAGALGVIEHGPESLLDMLRRALAQRELLLVIDNFEHVIQVAPLVSALLAAAPRLKALVTSRESLRLAGEQEYPVPPLSLPAADAGSAQDLVNSEAGALFIRRAQLARPHFAVSDDNALAIARICIQLDGLPLAIELAAARCKLLTPQALLARLEGKTDDSPFQALAGGTRDAPPRQRTLRDTMAWSYNLLDADEKTLFARLAVFQGGRSLEAIAAVCGAGLAIDVFDGLASLVDKNLVQQMEAPSGEPRFTLLEMIHAYARERLEASGEAAILRRRHAAYFVALAEQAEPELRLARYDHWCQVFEVELDNIRMALEWGLSAPAGGEEHGVEAGLRLAGALGLFWYGKGYHVEGIRWTKRLLARIDEAPPACHAKFLLSAAHMAMLNDLPTAQGLFRRALDAARRQGDQLQAAWALVLLGYTMMRDPAAARPIVEEALESFRALGHLPGIAQTLNISGEIARFSGDDGRAWQDYEECLAVCRQTGETRRICYIWCNQAYLAQHAGDYPQALRLARQGLLLALDRHDRPDIITAVIAIAGSIGGVSADAATTLRAARLLGAAEAAHERMGTFIIPSDTAEYARIVAGVRQQLADGAFQQAWAEGRAMTLDQAIAYALEEGGEAVGGDIIGPATAEPTDHRAAGRPPPRRER
jgi:predicted ATPase/DNA-binding CsgD family transcriptional regulator